MWRLRQAGTTPTAAVGMKERVIFLAHSFEFARNVRPNHAPSAQRKQITFFAGLGACDTPLGLLRPWQGAFGMSSPHFVSPSIQSSWWSVTQRRRKPFVWQVYAWLAAGDATLPWFYVADERLCSFSEDFLVLFFNQLSSVPFECPHPSQKASYQFVLFDISYKNQRTNVFGRMPASAFRYCQTESVR